MSVMPEPLLLSPPTAVDCAKSVIAVVDRNFEVLASEITLGAPELGVLGTADFLLRHKETDGIVIGDIKSAGSAAFMSAKYQGLSWAVQMTSYAYSRPVNDDLEFVEWADVGLPEPDKNFGAVIHVDRRDAVGALVRVRLDYDLVETALKVKHLRKTPHAEVVPS